MSTFHLQIVTADGLIFDDQVEQIILRTSEGDVGILKGHIDYMATLSTGSMRVKQDGKYRSAAVSGGFVSVNKEVTRVIATTCEFADQIDLNRAMLAKQKAEEMLKQQRDRQEMDIIGAKLKRAINRINVSGGE